ncbi:hypothetical protein BFP97_13535 [Roseivirga sp. 4D4]|uniref:class I SAM-dependent methyltransferase n=1 Tax=Roseivirga sp. 4D4 TaxID=1889784 RepID=UPI000853AC73|nr:class I SAM-dependent methyltransferase [Roseivirga sp. 4D4]OEK02480.1 hypothetical protein BFP97_13535 [Roseivirga sp. 4D4]
MSDQQFDSGRPFFSNFLPNSDYDWEMSRAEKYTLIGLLEHLKPDCSIEIGTYRGGSLQVISEYSRKVYSIDISNEPKRTLKEKFDNVSFSVGKSAEILPDLFKTIENKGGKLNFILVDGDHSKMGVYRDLRAILEYPHKNDLTVLIHDSFNPRSRKGMKMIDYTKYNHVEYIELDYVQGSFWQNDTYREMWGGFALVKIGGKERNTTVNESAEKAFKASYKHSVHPIKDALQFLKPLQRPLYRVLGRKKKSDKYMKFE